MTVKDKPVDNLKINADYATFSISYTLVADLLLGDVNGDGVVNITDITKIAAHVKGKKLLTANK